MDELSQQYFYATNGLLSAQFALADNLAFNHLLDNPEFQDNWEAFKLNALTYLEFNENEDSILGIRTINYLIDEYFASNHKLQQFLHDYFNHLAKTDK